MFAWWFLAILLPVSASRPPGRQFERECERFTNTRLPNTTVWFTEIVKAGTNLSLPENNVTCALSSQIVPQDICRIAMYVATSNRSGLSMEAWLPRNWTGRFLTTGNGGVSGCISYADMAYTTSLGFATVGANNGHNGTSGGAFYNNPEVVEDFAYRSLRTSTVLGKRITRQFYHRDYTKSYYFGCSTGGRQGLKAAQAFPHDFDGIVAGAPAISFDNLTSWSGHFLPLTGPPGSPTFVSPDQWQTVHNDILSQCDLIDGYKDGILEDPLLCNYNPDSLLCKSNNQTNCLTQAQVKTVRGVFSPLYGENGALVYPRMNPGSELIARFVYYSGQPFSYTVDWFRYAIYNNPNWDPSTIGPKDYAAAASKNPFNIETWDTLEKFQATGGKLLMYHGQEDPIISSDNSPRYYQHLEQAMDQNPSEIDEYLRFFRISGMGHCTGGEGAWAVGQGLDANSGLQPDRNILTAVVAWVENGTAPVSILGTKWVNDTVGGQVEFSRRHCKYPASNTYIGGDATQPDAWKCVTK